MQVLFLENGMLRSMAIFVAGVAITLVITYYLNQILTRSYNKMRLFQPMFISIGYSEKADSWSAILLSVMATILTAFQESVGVITSMLVAAGFASILVGLAAQSSFSNVISKLINSHNPFALVMPWCRNEFCFIEDIRLIHTIMRTWDNRRLVVLNSIVQNEVVINYSMKDPSVLVPVEAQVSYESDLSKAMQIMTEVAKGHPDCQPVGDLPNTVVMEFRESGILLRLLSRAKDQSTAFSMTRDILFNIKKEFDAHGLKIPSPRRQLIIEEDLLKNFQK